MIDEFAEMIAHSQKNHYNDNQITSNELYINLGISLLFYGGLLFAYLKCPRRR